MINVTLRFRYGDALHGIIKRPRTVLSADVWRDVGGSGHSRHNSMAGEEGDEGLSEEGAADENHNPLFDIFPAEITSSALQSIQEGVCNMWDYRHIVISASESKQRVDDLSMFGIASALWSGSIDEFAWASEEQGWGQRMLLSGPELIERDLQTRCACTHHFLHWRREANIDVNLQAYVSSQCHCCGALHFISHRCVQEHSSHSGAGVEAVRLYNVAK
jgi:hypothetical protein